MGWENLLLSERTSSYIRGLISRHTVSDGLNSPFPHRIKSSFPCQTSHSFGWLLKQHILDPWCFARQTVFKKSLARSPWWNHNVPSFNLLLLLQSQCLTISPEVASKSHSLSRIPLVQLAKLLLVFRVFWTTIPKGDAAGMSWFMSHDLVWYL